MSNDLVTVTEAATRLGLNKSNVSRQVRKLELARDGKGRFSFEEYERARAGELNPYMARGDAPLGANGVRPAANAATRLKEAQAERARLELDERKGLLIERAEVVQVVTDAVREMRDGMLGLPGRLAGQLASMTDAVEITRLIDASMRELLEQMAAIFERLAKPEVMQ